MARRLSGWRKLAASAWSRPMDPQFFGDMDVDAGPLLDYIEDSRRTGGEHVTMTHLVGRAVAHGLAAVPDLRVRIAHGRVYERHSIDVFFIVATRGGRELTGVKVADADRKTAVEIAAELNRRYSAIESGTADDLDRGKALLARLPPRLLGAALGVGAWLTSDLNLDLTRLGMPRQAFGGAMVTSVGMWGIDHAYSPLAHYYRVPVLVLVGAVRKLPVVVDDAVVIRPTMTLTATFDHRYVDGYHAAQFADAVRSYCADPAGCEAAKTPSPTTAPA
jgi:pyruvate/2-oxoglutarate dehydrogenase complex dihydrolipoamide acyltransferase (E2) component